MTRELTPEYLEGARWTRARLAAHRKAGPGDDLDELTRQCYDGQTEQDIADTAAMAKDVLAAPTPTEAQIAKLQRLFATPPEPSPADRAAQHRAALDRRLAEAERAERRQREKVVALRAELIALEEDGTDA
jgi:hypothetical protein